MTGIRRVFCTSLKFVFICALKKKKEKRKVPCLSNLFTFNVYVDDLISEKLKFSELEQTKLVSSNSLAKS